MIPRYVQLDDGNYLSVSSYHTRTPVFLLREQGGSRVDVALNNSAG